MRDVAAIGGRNRILWRALLVLAVPFVVFGSPAGGAEPDDSSGPVYFVDISGTIDRGLAPYLDRVLGDAAEAGASAIVLEIDTPGGRLDAVLQMRDALLESQLRTVAFVESKALSAGALVAIASRDIYMRPGAVMGAATPVVGGTGEVADEKTISAVRSIFEATAQERSRDPRLAAAMVDPAVEVEGVVEQGRLLTLTVSQAVEVGYADGVVTDRAALLAELGLTEREQVETSPTLAERLVRFITNPVTASLLITIGTLVLIGDLLIGGVGVGVLVGVALHALFFWGHMLAGLAGWEDVGLVALGLILIAVEVFVVPGFGVPGILGLVALLAGAFLAMINRDFEFVTTEELVRAGVTVAVTFAAVVAGLVVVLSLLARRGRSGGLVLHARLGGGAPLTERAPSGWLRWFGATSQLASERPTTDHAVGPGSRDTVSTGTSHPEAPESLVGATGTALSDLRPSGVADIDGARVDVVTGGEYLRRGDPIVVVRDDRYRRVVRRREP